MTLTTGTTAIEDDCYYSANCRKIEATRERTKEQLKDLGFIVTDSKTNFLFAKSSKVGGAEFYEKLKHRGILVRHFSTPRIVDYNRITIGTDEQMDAFIMAVKDILSEKGAGL
jgi:histidinol-phosphate aminotransferase